MMIELPSPDRPLRIGTRGSPLARAQAQEAMDRLVAAHGLPSEAFVIVPISTAGDRLQDQSLAQFGGKGLFIKEIEDALLRDGIDIAVHSMKDVPTVLPDGLAITCVLPSEDVRDAFVSFQYQAVADLPRNTIVGTSSIRRRAQLAFRRPDLRFVELRGNVQTRLRKIENGVAGATLLATAGINRLKLTGLAYYTISPDDMLPAVAQGAIGIEHRSDDEICAALLAPLNHQPTWMRLVAERAFLKLLDGSCRTPIAGLAEIDGGTLRFRGEIIRPDGSDRMAHSGTGAVEDAAMIGREAAEFLRARAGTGYFG